MLCLIPIGAALAAPPTEVGLVATVRPTFDLASDRPDEDTGEVWTRLHAEASQNTDRHSWFLAIDGEHRVRWGADTEAWWELRAGESGWSGRAGPVWLRAGLLVERWGKLDALPVIDVLNPRDLRDGPLTPPESLRIPVPMARAALGSGPIRGEILAIPFAGTDRISLSGSDWSLIRPGMIDTALADAEGWEGETGLVFGDLTAALSDGLDDFDPTLQRDLTDALATQGVPQAFGFNGEIATRIRFDAPGVDGSLVGGALRSHTPAVALDPTVASLLQERRYPTFDELDALEAGLTDPLSASYPRTLVAGADVGTSAGPFGLRAEGMWTSNRVVPTRWMGSATSPVVSVGAGVDWMHASWLTAVVEARWERMMDPPADPIFVHEDAVQIAGFARVSMFSERVFLTSGGLYDVRHREYLLKPEARWRPTDTWALDLGAIVLDGPTDPPTDLQDALGYEGGGLSYWGDNDCVYLAFSWFR